MADCLADSGKRASELKIACFGSAFKPNIDDLRESPAMEIAEMIAQWHTGETLVVEPNIHELPAKLAGHCTLTALDDALATADVLVLLVDHKEFKATPLMPYSSVTLLIPKVSGVEQPERNV